MIESDLDDDLPFADACRRALEAWACADPDPASAEHIATCPECRDLAESIALDQELLRWQLSRLTTPPAPVLELQEPLRAASGHPRRVSLTVVPFLLAVILVLLLAVQLMLGSIGREQRARRGSAALEDLSRVAALASAHLSAPTSPSAEPPPGWVELVAAGLGKLGTVRLEEGRLVDRTGGAIALVAAEDGLRWIAIGAGEDGELHTEDDLRSDRPGTE